MFYTDLEGTIQSIAFGSPFSLPDYLAWHYHMHFPTAFFRTAALHDIGLLTRDWALDCGEVELWVRLGDHYRIDYLPGFTARYAQGHDDQLSNSVQGTLKLAKGVRENDPLFLSESDLLRGDPAMVNYCAVGNLQFAARFLGEKTGFTISRT